jgi:hypothetical protein
MKRFVLIMITLVLSVGLVGCALHGSEDRGDVVTGMGKVYETRGDTATKMPRLQLDAVMHCEDRTAESAIRDFVAVLNNSLGWTQAVTAIATTGERITGEAVGEDRAEKLFSLSLDNPHKANVPDVIREFGVAMDRFEQSQPCEIFVVNNSTS